jgi:hypothetical protein
MTPGARTTIRIWRKDSPGRARDISATVKSQNCVAERVGFEPTVEFPQHTLSKRAP